MLERSIRLENPPPATEDRQLGLHVWKQTFRRAGQPAIPVDREERNVNPLHRIGGVRLKLDEFLADVSNGRLRPRAGAERILRPLQLGADKLREVLLSLFGAALRLPAPRHLGVARLQKIVHPARQDVDQFTLSGHV